MNVYVVFFNKNSEVSYQPISVDCGNRKSFLIFSISVTWQVKSCKRKRAKNFSLVAKKIKIKQQIINKIYYSFPNLEFNVLNKIPSVVLNRKRNTVTLQLRV